MYVNPAFRTSQERALGILRDRAFGTFVVPTAGGAPTAVHVPFLVFDEDDRLRVELHVARANPLHAHIPEAGVPALLCCTGPDAYISPEWYGMPDEVPTWTYTAVHLSGTARLLPQKDNLAHVDRMAAFFEGRLDAGRGTYWTTDKVNPQKRAAMLRAIVGIELLVADVEAQLKLIQHKDDIRHHGAIKGLRGQADAGAQAIADLMPETLDLRSAAVPDP